MADGAFLHDMAQGTLLLENLLLRLGGKAAEINLDSAKFHRLVRTVEQQHNFAEILAPFVPLSQEAQMNLAAMETFESRGHIALMNEQLPVWLWHTSGRNFGDGRQGQSRLGIELVQGMRQCQRRGRSCQNSCHRSGRKEVLSRVWPANFAAEPKSRWRPETEAIICAPNARGSFARASGIPRPSMLRLKEFVQEAVHLQESLPGD